MRESTSLLNVKMSHALKQTSRLYNSIQLANSQCSSYPCPEPEPWVQLSSELGLVLVDEVSLVVGDAVKGQDPCMLVQIDTNSAGFW